MCIIASVMTITNLFYVIKSVCCRSADMNVLRGKLPEPMEPIRVVDSKMEPDVLELHRPKQSIGIGPLNETQNKRKQWKILVFVGIDILKQWRGFAKLSAMKKHDISYTATIECPKHNQSIFLTLGSDVKLLDNQDSAVFGMAPDTLRIKWGELRKINNRFRSQSWIFFGLETPLRTKRLIKDIGEFKVDYTWSYISSADIQMPYAYFKPLLDNKNKKLVNVAKTKNRLIAWMGNNCKNEAFWPRMKFIEKLNNVIGVDTYGKCGRLECQSENCTEEMSHYKFFLALENAECDEYITDQFWLTSLANNVVPIVYGPRKEDYFRFAPRYSFIHVGDFQNISLLVDFINILNRNDNLYNKFFQWKGTGKINNVYSGLKPSSFCSLIPTLKNGPKIRKPLKLGSWFQSCRRESNSANKIFT
ncbi:glycoprotein 3-alpha-L-fucosyltransferase A-like isoform X2 [Anneissia japonica]|nr:glycoprotein 3-alpha-L-fucosyltransferase A-like isoform X2 [Anneissia japonica]